VIAATDYLDWFRKGKDFVIAFRTNYIFWFWALIDVTVSIVVGLYYTICCCIFRNSPRQ